MKMFSKIKQGGFTLIEIILTLVIAAVVGAGLVQYLGSSLTKSSVPIQRLRQAYALQQVMENITADYKEQFEENLIALKGKIDDPSTSGYGTYTVVTKFIKFTPSGPEDPVIITDPGEKNLLKVTIRNNLGETLTTLFSTF